MQIHSNDGRYQQELMPCLSNIEYSETRCQLARRCEHDEPHRFAILSGGFVSEAKFSVIKKNLLSDV